MDEVILGKNVYIEFPKADVWTMFGCADNMTFRMTTTLVETTTEGDGIYEDFEGDSIGYTIDVSGLLPINTSHFTGFDMMTAQKQMVALEFRMYFEDQATTQINAIYGTALVVDSTINSPIGHATGAFSLKGKGEPHIGLPPTCSKSISDYTVTQTLAFLYRATILELNEGTVPRYDYRVDGGAVQTSFDTSWSFTVHNYGDHTIEIWPVCENGAQGTKLTHNFETTIGL